MEDFKLWDRVQILTGCSKGELGTIKSILDNVSYPIIVLKDNTFTGVYKKEELKKIEGKGETKMCGKFKITEWCGQCETEVELEPHFIKQTCPNCGEDILPCSMCGLETCSDCPLDEDRIMSVGEYQDLAMTTAPELTQKEMLLNGALGLCGESGEIADHIKKHMFQGHSLDTKEIEKELGDVCWYIALMCTGLDIDMGIVLEKNIMKLKERYPQGFESERSVNRKC